MFHLLPFALGALAGAAAVNLVRRGKTTIDLDKAQDHLRQAAAAGLTAVEKSSARLREKLASTDKKDEAGGEQANPAPPANEPTQENQP